MRALRFARSIFPFASLALAGLIVGVTAPGCAMGGGSPDDGATPGLDAGRPDASQDAGVDAGRAACDPPCTGTDVCAAGTCVPAETDADGDGVPASVDCDDDDDAVGAVAERACSSACGDGVERCTDGTYGACSAPTTCDCAAGDPPRMIACARCGQQRQVCTDGRWVNQGVCSDQGACTPGTMEDGAACACGVMRRSCDSTCTWSDFTCTGGGECAPTDTETMTGVACGNCGTMTRTRTCNATTCMWNGWQDGTCTGQGECAPGTTLGGCDTRSSGAPTSCGQQTCTSSCEWGACGLAPGAACLSESGSNFQCCTAPGNVGGWQFCSPSTCQWNPCEAHAC